MRFFSSSLHMAWASRTPRPAPRSPIPRRPRKTRAWHRRRRGDARHQPDLGPKKRPERSRKAMKETNLRISSNLRNTSVAFARPCWELPVAIWAQDPCPDRQAKHQQQQQQHVQKSDMNIKRAIFNESQASQSRSIKYWSKHDENMPIATLAVRFAASTAAQCFQNPTTWKRKTSKTRKTRKTGG